MVPSMRIEHSIATSVLKGEDLVLAEPLSSTYPEVMLYMVCDGHSGVDAATLVISSFRSLLQENLGPGLLDIDSDDVAALADFAEGIRRAVCETFIDLENMWRERQHLAGTTVTLALLIRDLLTVANVGDSSMVLDTGCSTLELSCSHRLQCNASERARLKKADRLMAQLGLHLQGPAMGGEMGVGPLRVWPGGLCVSRSVGDVDVGMEIVPLPHVKQLVIPTSGFRIILASDGLWDHTTPQKAAKVTRQQPAAAAAQQLVDSISARPRGATDDVSVVVVDFLPAAAASFCDVAAAAAPALGLRRRGSRGRLLGCFGWEEEELDARDAPVGAGHVSLLADVDGLYAYPDLLERIDGSSTPLRGGGGGSGGLDIERKYTLHDMGSMRPTSVGGASAASAPCTPRGGYGSVRPSHDPDGVVPFAAELSAPQRPPPPPASKDPSGSHRLTFNGGGISDALSSLQATPRRVTIVEMATVMAG